MGNSMDVNKGTGVTASNTVPRHDRYIAGRTHASSHNASKEAPAFQTAGPDQQLAGTETSKIGLEVTASPVGRGPQNQVPPIALRVPSKRPSRRIAIAPAFRPTTVGTVRRCGPGSWIPGTGPGRKRPGRVVTIIIIIIVIGHL